MSYRSFVQALFAAALFGIATPFSKSLLADLPPNALAGLLYLGAALFLLPAMVRRRRRGDVILPRDRRNRLLLAGAIVSGGIVGPVLLLVGLRHAFAASVSMALNLETTATAILAVLFFHEQLGRWTWTGNAGVLLAGILLGFGTGHGGFLGIAFVGGAAIAWGLDNNLTALIDGIAPEASTFWKGLIAGTTNLAIGLALSDAAPGMPWVWALALGGVSYGASIVLYIASAQVLGATRSQMVFASAPFFGVIFSVLWLGERLAPMQIVAAIVLAVSVVLLFRERHEHEHEHEAVAHEHEHRHDDGHHLHAHEGLPPDTRHFHVHAHTPRRHSHSHWPDLHHRHVHPHDG